MRVWVKSSGIDSNILDWVKKLDSFLENNGVEVYVDPVLGHVLRREVLPESEAERADFAIILGGDGALLRSVQKSNGRLPPVIGFTVIGVGFFLYYKVEDYPKVLANIFSGKYGVESVRLGEYVAERFKGVFLNELSVWPHTGRLIEFEVSVGGEKLYHARSDGIIVATAAGSTAHALSYGSPIIMPPDTPVLEVVFPGVLSPLIKPLITYSHEIELQVMTLPALMSVDGQNTTNLEYASIIRVKPSDMALKLVKVSDYMRSFNERIRLRLTDRGLSRII
ncbi:MAG: NAD(+)/NADH kinase [Infirmifilum sp.]|jgi:NAD+ kinase|uniref:NAD(+)/NADH kinase n=1 Tax=Infirmifilum TaxID=2856573 RepID=UPI0023579A2A